MANLAVIQNQFFDSSGVPLSGGKVFTYAAGTTTLKTTYTDATGITPNTNPIILNSRGEAQIWMSDSLYKIVLTDSVGSVIYTQDNISPLSSVGIGYQPSGTGAVPTTVQAKLRESVSVKDFGAVGDGVTDDTAAIQAAITAAKITINGSIVNKAVIFPAGTYLVSSTITSDTNVVLVGSGRDATLIRRPFTVAGTLISTTAGASIEIDGMTFNGMPAAGARYFTVGTVCLSTTGNIYLHDSRFNGFEQVHLWGGGYYHKVRNCAFEYNSIVFSGVDANNFQVAQCRFRNADRIFTFFGGSGPVTFLECSFELITTSCVEGVSGAANQVANFIGCYFENQGDLATTGTGLATAFYNNLVVAVSVSALVFQGNSLSCLGIRRVLSNSTVLNSLVSLGNRFNIPAGATSEADYLYYSGGGFKSVTMNDQVYPLAASIGAYTTVYLQGTVTGNSVYYDPISATSKSIGNVTPLTVGKGVDFAVGAAGSGTVTSNVLGYYETGTFVPRVDGSTAAGTGTYSIQLGRYTRIGNLLHYTLQLAWSAHTGTGNLRVANLPYASNAAAVETPTASYATTLALTAGYIASFLITSNTSYLYAVQTPTGGGGGAFIPMDTAVGNLEICGFYEI